SERSQDLLGAVGIRRSGHFSQQSGTSPSAVLWSRADRPFPELMNPLSEPLSRSPELFPHVLDVGTDSVSLIRLTEMDYERASFLDARIVGPGTLSRSIPFAELQAAIDDATLAESADFVFHIGHVGSTLL